MKTTQNPVGDVAYAFGFVVMVMGVTIAATMLRAGNHPNVDVEAVAWQKHTNGGVYTTSNTILDPVAYVDSVGATAGVTVSASAFVVASNGVTIATMSSDGYIEYADGVTCDQVLHVIYENTIYENVSGQR